MTELETALEKCKKVAPPDKYDGVVESLATMPPEQHMDFVDMHTIIWDAMQDRQAQAPAKAKPIAVVEPSEPGDGKLQCTSKYGCGRWKRTIDFYRDGNSRKGICKACYLRRYRKPRIRRY